MDPTRLEALRLASACGGDSRTQVERAEMFVKFMEGGSAPAASAAMEAAGEDQAGGARPEGGAEAPNLLMKLEDARQFLVSNMKLREEDSGLREFMLAGMPEWMARAAVAAMRDYIGDETHINAEERRKTWIGFAMRYCRMSAELRAPEI
ncbi:hypothetical protein [uncultured Methylobacterium sp.]|jgi:hypothetical protein|uniref:hypothetical protein n=1 Tax=uncultured Methylobacterium sp. TaxID=157278 RepID=UPI00262C82BF|nr:hypothetical protein [uncultured Methylobacterium sp.]